MNSKFTPTKILIAAGVIALAISGVSWWKLVYSNPSNVFDRMLANSLATPSVTKVVAQSDDSQKLQQTSQLVTEPSQIVHAKSVLGQTTDADTSIITESIGTPETDFVRYTNIKTSQKSSSGKDFDFSSVIGVWGKSGQDSLGNGAQLFNQTVLGVVPVANLPQPQRSALLKQIKNDNVYKQDAKSVKRQLVNGRPMYIYNVSVAPVAYVTMLKNFARDLGLKQLEQVDPAQYKDSQPLQFSFEVDVWSSQLLKVSYSTSDRTESYSAYGARTQISVPTSSIGVDELQSRLQQVQ